MAASKPDEASIFNAARQIEDPAARHQYVGQACGEDLALAGRLEALLRAHDQDPTFLASPTRALRDLFGTLNEPLTLTAAPALGDEGPGTQVGPYQLLRQIGEGGMGTVFLAEQFEPIQRQVAVKVIRPGMDSRQVLARFEAERQALALMDHPNIARVLDAGTTPAGRPYFVMERIDGVPITDYCDRARLSVRQRLELFVPVCQAVQHAHQKGIIHRDLKPSNVLVTLYDGKAVPKVIDFGIAKATGQKLTERTLETEVGSVVGTLEYMSPEQAEPGQLDVDTRSDIYSLGVVLYELLTGTTPLEPTRLEGAALLDLLRVIREVDPPKPSKRLSNPETLPSVAAARRTESGKLVALVRGELDWIVLKCLEKDWARRYQTANDLALDLQRYLNDEPVEACPPSASYRLRKYVRRNKGPVLSALAITLALLGGTGVALWQAVDATRARDVALQAAAAESAAKDTAKAKEEETHAVLQFVEKQILAAARPKGQDGGLGPDVSLRAAIESAVPFVDKSFKDQPLIEARLRLTLGTSFSYLGDAKSAAEQQEAARALYTQHRGLDHPDTLQCVNNLANSYAALGRHADALKLREETLALRKAKLGPDHPETLISMGNLANSYQAVGRQADALKLFEETLALRKAKLGPDHPATLSSVNNLAGSYFALGRQTDALKLFEEALALRKAKLGDDHPDTLESMNNLAVSYAVLGRHADALKLREETLALRKARLGDDHPHTLESMNNLAISYAALGRQTDALKLFEEALALRKAKLGDDHPETLASMYNLAASYAVLGRHADALKLREETLALYKGKLGPDHPETLLSMWAVAESLIKLERGAEAVPIIDDCVQRAAGRVVHPALLSGVIDLRLRRFAKNKDGAGCRASAEMGEKLDRRDADSLYYAACWRAITAQVLRDTGATEAETEADRAIAWLRQAVAAGYRDAAHAATDHDLDVLRDRRDFQELLGQLQARSSKDPK